MLNYSPEPRWRPYLYTHQIGSNYLNLHKSHHRTLHAWGFSSAEGLFLDSNLSTSQSRDTTSISSFHLFSNLFCSWHLVSYSRKARHGYGWVPRITCFIRGYLYSIRRSDDKGVIRSALKVTESQQFISHSSSVCSESCIGVILQLYQNRILKASRSNIPWRLGGVSHLDECSGTEWAGQEASGYTS